MSGIGTPLVALNLPVTLAVESAPTTSPSLSEQALELFWQGYRLYQDQQVEAAIAPWQQALTLYQQAQDRAGERSTLSALGSAYLNLEDYGQAIAHLEQFLSRVEAESAPLPEADRLAQAQVLSNLGVAYREVGQYARAVTVQEQALHLMQSLGDAYQSATGRVWGNLGNAYAAVGDYNAAIQAHQQALAIVQAQNDAVGEAETLSNLGVLYANEGDYDEAIAQYQQSLVRLEALGSQPEPTRYHQAQAHLLLNMASAYHAKSDLDRAEVYYRQSLTLAQEVGDRSLEAMGLGSLGMVQEEREDLEGAIALQRESLVIARTLGDPRLEATVQNNLGHTLFNQGQYREAEELLRQAIAHLESLRPGLSDLDNIALFDSQIFSYNLLQQILVARERYEAALEVSERGRARAFAELLTRRSNPGFPSDVLPPPTVEEMRAIAQRQNATLVEYAIVADDAFRFQGRQRGREAELLIWVVPPSGAIAFRRVDLQPLWDQNRSSSSLSNLVASSRRALGVRGEERDGASATSFDWPKLQQLHEHLIAPIEDLLPAEPTAPVIIIPQDALFLVPFAALQDTDGRYLIERHTLLTAPSIQVIGLAQAQQGHRETRTSGDALASVLLVGNPTMPAISSKPGDPPQPLAPLPGSEQEARDIARLLNVPALLGEQATEVTVRDRMPTARIIHLATHGLLNYGQAQQGRGRDMPGAIALAPSEERPALGSPPLSSAETDGLLTTAEILSLRLNADLVVLSACNTGRGEITGDGVIGLSRSFISAGAASIIVSLWAVSDTSTAFVMTHFYENLRQGQGKAQALRQAMLDAKNEYNHPFDWAAFTLIGEAQ
ncbi:CHAT domain-containing protein [Leptolyngbya sp. FACHB-8]|uniref:CHAT domain-containing protein n=1 Tax=unclassified Leptolyngbya TaxID=2650499 RepID=UPI0016868AA1|nr:CHAT domain-containing protein [Leptolyngbya sp. FACHB-8]MBD2156407.1 CHAT domain-containing protein [Leptolyngbya sp. FACHB-16]